MTFELATAHSAVSIAHGARDFGFALVRDAATASLKARGPVAIRAEAPADADAREALLDAAFGPARFLKTCERLREGRAPARGLALVSPSPRMRARSGSAAR
jgi:hypothetical protein